jgi:hypothetical protein
VRSEGDIRTVFLQDAWRPVTNLTVKPGLRLDRVTHDNAAGERIADMSLWQPRLGIAWDVLGNARHVVRGSAGRYMDTTSLSLPDFASGVEGVGIGEYDTLEYLCNSSWGMWCDAESLPASFGEPFEWTSWDGQQYTLIEAGGITWPDTARTVDQLGVGRLRSPYVDEWILAYEAQIAPEASLEISRVKRKARDLIEDTCSGNEWAWGAAPMPSYDDPSTWTADADCGEWVIVNMPGLERDYDAWILRLEGRRDWGYLMASYTYGEDFGNTESGPAAYAQFYSDFFPVSFYNTNGSLTSPHRVRLDGYVLLPAQLTLGFNGSWISPKTHGVVAGCPNFLSAESRRSTADQITELGVDPSVADYCITPDGAVVDTVLFLENWTTREDHAFWQLDLQLAKAFRIGNVNLQAIFSIQNVFNTEAVTDVNVVALLQDTDADGNGLVYQNEDPSQPYYDEYYGADSSPVLVPIGAPTSYQLPRRYEIGLRLEF